MARYMDIDAIIKELQQIDVNNISNSRAYNNYLENTINGFIVFLNTLYKDIQDEP